MGQDLLFALRSLRKNLAFTLTVLLTLTLGVGANTAIFSVLHSVVLRSLPYPHSERLVRLYEYDAERDFQVGASLPNFGDWKARSRSFDLMEAFRYNFRTLEGDPENRIPVLAGSPGLLEMVGVRPVIGRVIEENDIRPDAPEVAVLSFELWVSRYASDPGIIGDTIRLNDSTYTVIGVATPITGPLLSRVQAILPWAPPASFSPGERGSRGQPMLGRLREGVSLHQARTELQVIGTALRQEHPGPNDRYMPLVVSLYEETVSGIRPTLLALFGATVLILLIAVANIANLFLARGISRRPELTVRAALGAGAGRLTRLLLTESMLLAVLGGAAGITLGWALVRWFLADSPNWIPRLREISVDPIVLLLAVAVTLVTGLVLGLAPLLAVGRGSLRTGIQLAGHGQAQQLERGRLRSALVVVQLALSLVMLTGAGLMIRSFIALQNVPLGIDFAQIVTFSDGGLRVGSFGDEQAAELQLRLQAVENIQAIPGVVDATLTSQAPLSGSWGAKRIEILTGAAAGRETQVDMVGVVPGFFPFFATRAREGRLFEPADQPRANDVVVVDANLATLIWGEESAVGQRVRIDEAEAEIIGVSEPIRYGDLAEEMRPKLYLLMGRSSGASGGTFLIRHQGEAEPIIEAVKTRVAEVDASIRTSNIQPLEAIYDRYLRQPRLYLTLIASLGALALIVAAVGVFGVISYSVGSRTTEVGIRIALGADSSGILKLFSRRTAGFLMVGLAAGGIASLWLNRYLESLLFEVEPTDPIALSSMALLLTVVALVATWLPARRALGVDPSRALRSE